MNVSMIMEFMNECFIVSCDISGVNTTKIGVGTVKGNDFINLSSDIENASEAELTVIMSVLASGAALGKKVTSPNAKVPVGISRYAVRGNGSVVIKPAEIA